MERLKYEIPSLDRKQDAIDFINEFYCAKNQILVSVVKKIVSKNIKVLHPV